MPSTAARIYDYMLGGTHNFPADQEAARQLIEQFPVVPLAVRANRATLRRMVSYLSGIGVRQFLDVGSGMPTQSNVHEVAHSITPESRVVYVDIDPVAVSESLELLAGTDHATAVLGDLGSPQAILDHPRVREVLDFDQPVALLLMGILHFVADDNVAVPSVAHLVDALPSGSHLALSHGTADFVSAADAAKGPAIYRNATAQLSMRTREQVLRFFDGLELLEPGLVTAPLWRPDTATSATDAEVGIWAGVGRKP
jgi:hypothetical protein